jgi:aldehyde dehydrogenase (NAD+)
MVSSAPERVPNAIAGEERAARSGEVVDKYAPATGELSSRLARSRVEDVSDAVGAARNAFPAWSRLPAVKRGELLHQLVQALEAQREPLSRLVALETGKSLKLALGETDGAIALGRFYASEGQRFYGRTTTSSQPNRQVLSVREPLGVAGLIIAANTPLPNIAWKVFPALICGNTAVLKASEDIPASCLAFARIAKQAGLPDGVLNVIQGVGEEAGAALVADRAVSVTSFTGSSAVGRKVAEVVARRLGRVSLELGGKNPFVVCEDADLPNAVHWALLSSFSNAGQRCAAASRVIVVDAIYDRFREAFVERARKLRVGSKDEDDLGPVINARQLARLLSACDQAVAAGGTVLTGGKRLAGSTGYYLEPTVIEGLGADDELSCSELFGPVVTLYRVPDFEAALALANHSPYGLTAAIHTQSIHRAMRFVRDVQAGMATVNIGTFGSEPHFPFGGVKDSGTGWREPGTEALDVYSNLKNVVLSFDPGAV